MISKKNITVQILFSLVTTLFVHTSKGQEAGKGSPLKNMEFLIADWKVSNFEIKEGQWSLVGDTHSSIKAILKGSFLSEKVKYLVGASELNMVIHIGHDDRIGLLKLSAMDQEYGFMDIYTGKFLEEKIVFTNLGSDQPIAFDEGKKLSFRLTYSNIREESFEHLVEGTYDEGLTWFPFAKSIYRKQLK
ncbi:hypothetical protein [uncultured Croceitalea sp.]|uniref:hypothetical protein n=1 Tax=uncultured Croceitalea sp. TaxID=1798908 RepID=UPI0033064334